MRKQLLLALAALPLVGFSANDNFVLDYLSTNGLLNVRLYYCSGSSYSYSSEVYGLVASDLPSFYFDSRVGMAINLNSGYVSLPSLAAPGSITSLTVGYPVKLANTNICVNLSYFPEVKGMFQTVAALLQAGYRSSAIEVVGSTPTNYRVNFTYSRIVADCLYGTNTLYRSLVLSSLSSINQSVVNIDTGVTQLRPVLDDIRDINTVTASNTADLVETSRGLGRSLDYVATNSTIIASNASTIAAFIPNILTDLDNLHNDASLQSLDVYLGDNTQSWLDFLQWSVDNNYIDSTLAASLAQDLQSTDPQRRGRSYSIPDAHRRFFVKSQIKHGVVEAVKLRGRYQSFVTNISNNDAAREGLQNAGAEFNHSVTYQLSSNHAAAMDWREQLRQDLQAWKTSDEHGILNIKKSIDDNFVTRSTTSTNSVPFTAYVTNYVTRVVTNSIEQASENISSNVQDSAQRTRDLLNDTLLNPEFDGINVRIKYPIYGVDQMKVNVHDEALDVVGSGIDQLNAQFDDWLTDSGDRWQTWFDMWNRDAPGFSNAVYEVGSLITNDLYRYYFEKYKESDSMQGRTTEENAAIIFGAGFDSSTYNQLPWFSRMEVLLFQLSVASTNTLESASVDEHSFDSISNAVSEAGINFVNSSIRVVGIFGMIKRFVDSFALAFESSAAPNTTGIVLLPAGNWLSDQALVLQIPIQVQNALRLCCRCIWWVSAIVIGWVFVSWAWSKVVVIVRWLWSLFDI